MEKYLYLEKIEYAQTWIAGGQVPLKMASSYLSHKREATTTIDETKIYSATFDPELLGGAFRIGNAKGWTFEGCSFEGRKVDGFIRHYRLDDGLILSLSNSLSDSIAERLKKIVVVKIIDVEELKRSIDTQLGIDAEMRDCEYTIDHERNHFLKSIQDAWQEEFRLLWKTSGPQMVTIPSGIAVFERDYLPKQ